MGQPPLLCYDKAGKNAAFLREKHDSGINPP